MQYKAILLERERKFIIGDDIYLTFIILDSNGNLVNSLSGWTFNATLNSDADSVSMTDESGEGHFIISGNKVQVKLVNSDTISTEYSLPYIVELQGILNGDIYTLCQEEIWFSKSVTP